MTNEAIESVYLFIAELLGYKKGTVSGKLAFGMGAYDSRTLVDAVGDDLHVRIWLERLYGELDRFTVWMLEGNNAEDFFWEVPIELDASASMLSYMGVLIGDKRLVEMCNGAGDPEVLNDPWHIEGLTREKVKKVGTPRLYGSSTTAAELWKKANLEFTHEDVQLINNELKNGAMGMADRMKEFIISNCNMRPEMRVHVGKDKFTIKCNRYKRVGELTMAYDLFDTESGAVRRVHHTKTKAVPDLDRFALYTVTLLIHGLDSQIADYVAGKVADKYNWVLDIHDAFIISPIAAADCRKWYAEAMTTLFVQRKAILANYFRSIGIPASALPQWEALVASAVPLEEGWHCRPHVLK